MTEDNCPRVSSSESTDSSTTKQRKKRKWDQAAESLVSAGIPVPAVIPLSNMGILAGIASSGVPAISNVTFTNHLASTGATLTSVLQVPLQQHGAAIVQKLNQPKIQDELIAREIVINDADSAVRYKLTKRQTQEEIQKCTGAIVITRGKYRPPNAPPDGEKPLYLHISAGAHLETTAERIKAVDSAAAMVEETLKHGSSNDGAKGNHSLSTCVFLGFEADPSLNIAAHIRGPNDQYVNHIMNETGATVLLKGRGSGNPESIEDDADGQQPLHLFLSSNNSKGLERAKLLAENLLDTISAEFGASRVSSSKVYGAVPPPPQLLAGVQGSGAEPQLNHLPDANLIASAPVSVSSMVSPVIVGGAPSVASKGMVSHVGWSNSGQSQANTGCSSSLIGGTSYIGYGGIYPQATPLQQVALALRQSALPVTATVAPATRAGCSTSNASAGSSLEKEKHSSQKRKFQELPATLKRPSNLNQKFLQGSELSKPCDLTSDVGARESSNIPAAKKLIEPSTNGMLPPPPKKVSPPPITPPPPKFNSTPMPPPAPKFTSIPSLYDDKSMATESRAESVPDTLIKLMEYGDDDDDEPEETSQEPFKRKSNSTDAPKPFWAV